METRPPEHARISFLRWTLVKKYKIVRFEKVWILVVFWESFGIKNRCQINKMTTRGRPKSARGPLRQLSCAIWNETENLQKIVQKRNGTKTEKNEKGSTLRGQGRVDLVWHGTESVGVSSSAYVGLVRKNVRFEVLPKI